jgi:predicted RNA binding protein YcfA (HicA-like mRNA interferase family)
VYDFFIRSRKGGRVKSSELIKKLEANGWTLERINGSHHQFKHPDFAVLVTVPHPRKDIKLGTLRQIMKDAKLK